MGYFPFTRLLIKESGHYRLVFRLYEAQEHTLSEQQVPDLDTYVQHFLFD
jgi:hypothetical protein